MNDNHDTDWTCPKTRLKQFYSGAKIGYVLGMLTSVLSYIISRYL